MRWYRLSRIGRRRTATIPVGTSVEAYYGVNRPAQAYLIRETSAGPIIFIIVGLIVPIVTWLVVKYLI